MIRKISVSMLALIVAGIAGPAMAVSSDGGVVNVNINVVPTVSMWSNDTDVNLVLDGTGQENYAVFESALSVINNVDAHIDAQVDGTLPDDIIPGQSPLNFFIFNSGDAASAHTAIVAVANAPAGALVWTNDNLGDSQELFANTGVNPNIVDLPIVYAADAPNSLPAVSNWDLTVTYTITSN